MYENLVEALRLNVEYRQADNALSNASRAADVAEVVWKPRTEPPDTERNIFICYGSPDFKSVCVGHYERDYGQYYEDRNFFAKPLFDAMYWCEMPRVPSAEMEADE